MVDRPWWSARTPVTSRARSWTTRGAIAVTIAAVMLAGAGAAAVRGVPVGRDAIVREGVRTTAPSVHALTLGCGPVREVLEPTSVVGWVDTPAALPYQTPVPAAGWFHRELPIEGDVSTLPEKALHAMWSGARALWVSPQAGPDALVAAKGFASANPDLGLTVWVWPTEYDYLPRTYAVAAWGITQECHELDRDTVLALLDQAPPTPGAPGQDPPQAFATEETAS